MRLKQYAVTIVINFFKKGMIMTVTTKLSKSIVATAFLAAASATAYAHTVQTVPLNTYVNAMMQQTTALNSQEVHFAALESVANMTHQISLDDQPQFAPNINVIDIVQNTISVGIKELKNVEDEAE